eukprot:COSAG03_NODE_1991_length_3253_cov_15.268548_3_plen_63_part_00
MVAFAPAVGMLLTAVAAPPERGLNLPATQGSSGTGAFLLACTVSTKTVWAATKNSWALEDTL